MSTQGFDLTAASKAIEAQGNALPPLEKWNPEFCGDIDMRIARDGTWFYNGTPIGRLPMVKMFSRVLWMEEGKFFLKTPVEKVGIQVDDAPFILENIYEHEGATGHEIVFVAEVVPENEAALAKDQIHFKEGNGLDCVARWFAVEDFLSGELELYPNGLLEELVAQDKTA